MTAAPDANDAAAPQFTERSGIENGFAAVFEGEIAPKLAALKSERSGLRQRTLNHLKILAVATLVIAALLPLFYGLRAAPFSVLPLIGGGFLGYWLVRRRDRAWNRTLIDTIMPSVLAFLGSLAYDRYGADDRLVDVFEQYGLVGRAPRRRLTHHFSGIYRNTGFELVHARLTRRGRGKNADSSTLFEGLLFNIQVPASIPGTIVILPNLGTFLQRFAHAMEPAALRRLAPMTMEHPDFDEKFAVRTDRPEDARRFLTPGFMTALLDISREEGGTTQTPTVTAAFAGNAFVMALSRYETAFSLGPLKFERARPFLRTRTILRENQDLDGTIHAMFDDIAVAYRVIDRLHGR